MFMEATYETQEVQGFEFQYRMETFNGQSVKVIKGHERTMQRRTNRFMKDMVGQQWFDFANAITKAMALNGEVVFENDNPNRFDV